MNRYDHLAGTVFPSGRYTPAPHHARLWADAVGADPEAGFPLGAAYMVAARGGAPIAAIMELLEAEPEQTLFAELGFQFEGLLEAGLAYAVESQLVSVERKRGRRLPSFDLVRLSSRILDRTGHGELVATVDQAWAIAREEPDR